MWTKTCKVHNAVDHTENIEQLPLNVSIRDLRNSIEYIYTVCMHTPLIIKYNISI